MIEPEETPIPGVRGLDHTADLGLEIRAPGLPELFRRAALGVMWLVLEDQSGHAVDDPLPTGGERSKSVELNEEELSTLLRSWLRMVLYWDETEGFVAVDASLFLLPTPLCDGKNGLAFGLRGEVVGRFDQGPRVREIKGVTLHGLRVGRLEGGWFGRVIFDV
ncbi:MAG: archease [Gemmatimonadota bacterium]